MSEGNIFHAVIRQTLGAAPRTLRVLDFGCGNGALVRELLVLGYDAHGCDVGADWPDDTGDWRRGRPATSWASEFRDRLRPIGASPYRLPYEPATFDAVISSSVFEHVQNKDEAFAEIARVLKPTGVGIHMLPSKWSLIEPHIFVPLCPIMWPDIPRWWLALWAFVGIRNRFQRGLGWREVTTINQCYCRDGVHYWSPRQFWDLFDRTFGGRLDLEHARAAGSRRTIVRVIRSSGLGRIAYPVRALFDAVCIGHPNLRAHRNPGSQASQRIEYAT